MGTHSRDFTLLYCLRHTRRCERAQELLTVPLHLTVLPGEPHSIRAHAVLSPGYDSGATATHKVPTHKGCSFDGLADAPAKLVGRFGLLPRLCAVATRHRQAKCQAHRFGKLAWLSESLHVMKHGLAVLSLRPRLL